MDSNDSPQPYGNLLANFGGLKASQIQSPYLNQYSLPQNYASEFIVPEGSARNRGRFELAFSQIGASVMLGSSLGSAVGTVKGVQEVSKLQAQLSVKRTQMLNYITRNGATMANTFGVITLTYSAIGVALSFVQEENDDLNTFISAASTGAVYGAFSQPKVAASLPPKQLTQLRLKRAGFGSLFGTIAAAAYVLLTNSDKYFSK